MTLLDHIAKSLFIRMSQYRLPDDADPSFHIYVPGSKWAEKHIAWDNLSNNDKAKFFKEAEIWVSNVREKSPITYSYLLNNFKKDDNLELL
jgi:hypothetical protein